MGIGTNVHDIVLSYMWPDQTKAPNNVVEIVGATAALTIILGFFVLWWLRNALRNT